MVVRVTKPAFNLRDKLSELDKPVGLKGSELMRSDTVQDARDLVSAGRKNLIINGGFDIWQRATDSGSNTTDGYLSADRWKHASSGATKQVTRQTFAFGQTDVPGNPRYYLRYAVTTSNNNVAIRQCIEDVTRTAGRELTLSFWVKGTNCGGGSFDLQFRQDFGSSGSASSVVDTTHFNYSVNNTWTRKTFTFTPPSISGKTLGTDINSSSYKIELFRQPDGDNSTGAFTLDFANVQLEYGSHATEFEQRSIGEELALCQRYYIQYGPSGGIYRFPMMGECTAVGVAQYPLQFPVVMRGGGSVSLTTNGSASDYNIYSANQARAASSITLADTFKNGSGDVWGCRVNFNRTNNDLVAGRAAQGYGAGTGILGFSREL